MTNTPKKPNQKNKQDNMNPSRNQSGRDFNRQNQNQTTGNNSEQTPRGKDSANPGQKMKDGFKYEEI